MPRDFFEIYGDKLQKMERDEKRFDALMINGIFYFSIISLVIGAVCTCLR